MHYINSISNIAIIITITIMIIILEQTVAI